MHRRERRTGRVPIRVDDLKAPLHARRARHLGERLNHAFNYVRDKQVISVKENHYVSGRLAKGAAIGLPRTLVRLEDDSGHVGIRTQHLARAIGRAIVDDYDLDMWVALSQATLDRRTDKMPVVEVGHANGNARGRGYPAVNLVTPQQ
jgi:N-acetyl-beta-hexosaminidase